MAQHCRLAFNSGFPLDQLSLIALATALSEDKSRVIDVGWIQGEEGGQDCSWRDDRAPADHKGACPFLLWLRGVGGEVGTK